MTTVTAQKPLAQRIRECLPTLSVRDGMKELKAKLHGAQITLRNIANEVEKLQLASQTKEGVLRNALEVLQRRTCERLCHKHEILSTSHHPDCDDARNALKAAS